MSEPKQVYYLTSNGGEHVLGTWHRSLKAVARIQERLHRAAKRQGGYSRSCVFKDDKGSWSHGEYIAPHTLTKLCLSGEEYDELRDHEIALHCK